MRTAVIILNWNTQAYLRRFLPPLIRSLEGLDAEVVVADNASGDGSRELLSEEFPGVRTILFDENLGFTGGYDRAVGRLLDEDCGAPEYIVLINSDVEVEPGWLQPLVRHLDGRPECGVCGPKLLALRRSGDGFVKTDEFEYAGAAGGCIDRYGYPFCRGRVLGRTERDEGQYDAAGGHVFWVSGACLATRASLWKRLGGLDGRFFAHMEEIDYCWRAALAGFCVDVVPESRVWHLGGGSLPQSSPFKLKLNFRNSLLMLDNNLAATVGDGEARKILRRRHLLDFCASAAYLLTGRFASYRAVREAYREYRELAAQRGGISSRQGTPAHACSGGAALPAGMYPFSIILKATLHGGKIFEYLRKYENNH